MIHTTWIDHLNAIAERLRNEGKPVVVLSGQLKARQLVQYVGRITRPHHAKTTTTVHDYHDELTPVLASSLRKRAPGYAQMGFPDPRTRVR